MAELSPLLVRAFPPGDTVLVDMDGVLADFDREFRDRMAARYPHIRQLDPVPDPPPFYISKTYPPEYEAEVWSISNQEGFVRSLPVIDGALEGWERILQAGYRPQICSAPLSTPHCAPEKRAWLAEHLVPHFGAWVLETAQITSDKHLVHGIALIDDRPPPLRSYDQAPWEHVIFDQPCNRTSEAAGYLRLLGWHDPGLPGKLALAGLRSRSRHQTSAYQG